MYYYVVNPAAGGGAIDGMQERLKATLRELRIDGEFAKTLGEGDADKITSSALDRDIKTIVAVGGGKTVNEVINAVYRHKKTDVAVGIIPIGKHNVLARALGIGDWKQACEVLASRRLIEYSLISANDHVLVQSLSIEKYFAKEPELEKPAPSWLRLKGTSRPAHPGQYEFKAQLNNKLKLRGEAERIIISNQKFLYPELDNSLFVQIYGLETEPSSSLANRLHLPFLGSSPHELYSQLHSPRFNLTSISQCTADLDGRSILAKSFDISLTEWKLRLITNLPR